MSLEHTTTTAVDLLSPDQAQWLADTMNRNTARFGGWSMEATGDGGDTGDSNPGTDDGDSQGSDDTDTGTGDANESTEDGDADKGDDTPEDKRVRKANKDAQRYRQELRDLQAKSKSQESILERLAAALNPEGAKKGDEKSPEALAAEVESTTQKLADTERELAVFKAAASAGANPQALLDSRSFLASLADVDASDGAAVTAAIKDAVKNNPAYRLTRGSASGGGELDPGKREGASGPTQAEFNKMTVRERSALKRSNPAAYKKLAGSN